VQDVQEQAVGGVCGLGVVHSVGIARFEVGRAGKSLRVDSTGGYYAAI